jgi:hypothetical protein
MMEWAERLRGRDLVEESHDYEIANSFIGGFWGTLPRQVYIFFGWYTGFFIKEEEKEPPGGKVRKIVCPVSLCPEQQIMAAPPSALWKTCFTALPIIYLVRFQNFLAFAVPRKNNVQGKKGETTPTITHVAFASLVLVMAWVRIR